MIFNKTSHSVFFFMSFTLIAQSNAFTVDKAIYGADNRNEVSSAPPVVQSISSAVMGHFSADLLADRGNTYEVQSTTLGKKHCSSVRFANEYTGPRCTGFLVAPNIVVTAGHCMNQPGDCENYVWAFDYKLNSANDQSYTKLPKSKVYKCNKLLAYKFEYFSGADYSIVELDRNVTDREPVQVDFEPDYSIGTPLYVLGHPSGLPMKYTDSATLNKNLDKVFESNLDVFGGNSGSPVFNANTNKVIGVVSQGHADWVGGSCKVEKVCTESDNCNPSVSSKTINMKEDFDKFVFKK
ncbi:MAG: trypsin-like serine peptidase [Bacteriovorax sp.]